MLDAAIKLLPDGALSYEIAYDDVGWVNVGVKFLDRKDEISLFCQPQNNFRVLLRLAKLLLPDYEVRLFRCTADSDTNGFLIRPASWWNEYRSTYPKQYTTLFQDISDLTKMWELEKAPKPDSVPSEQPPPINSTPSKPWWRFWG
jgi:hypothetical protein